MVLLFKYNIFDKYKNIIYKLIYFLSFVLCAGSDSVDAGDSTDAGGSFDSVGGSAGGSADAGDSGFNSGDASGSFRVDSLNLDNSS